MKSNGFQEYKKNMKSNGFQEVSKQDQGKKTNSKQAATGKNNTFFSLSKK